MADDDYEVVSHQKIEELKKEIGELRKRQYSDFEIVLKPLRELDEKVQKILDVFAEAAKDADDDSTDELATKMDALMDQNEKIATGLLAIADLVKEHEAAPLPATTPEPKPAAERTERSFTMSPPDMPRQQPLQSASAMSMPSLSPPPAPQSLSSQQQMQQSSFSQRPPMSTGSGMMPPSFSSGSQGMAPPPSSFTPRSGPLPPPSMSRPTGMPSPPMNTQRSPSMFGQQLSPPPSFGPPRAPLAPPMPVEKKKLFSFGRK